MTTMEVMETEEFICSVFFLPKKCFPQFNNFQKQLLSISQRFQMTVEKFHKLTKTKETEELQQLRKSIKNLADTEAVQVTIFGKFHDEISSRNLVTTRNDKYLTLECVPSRIRRNEWMAKSVQCSDDEGKPVAHIYMVYVHKIDKILDVKVMVGGSALDSIRGLVISRHFKMVLTAALFSTQHYEDLAQDIQKEISSLSLPSYKNLLLLVGLDPSLEREDSSMKQFEKAIRNAFHNTTKGNIHGEGEELDKEDHVYFKSSLYEDLISSEGELPKLIQTHLEWKVVQPLLDMRELIESNTRIYRKNAEETFQGPVAVEESLKKRFLETFLKNRRYIIDSLLGKFFFQEGIMDCEKMAEVLLENLAQVLQCLMVEVVAKIYGVKEYHIHEMLEGMVFKEWCSKIIRHCIRVNFFQSLPSNFFIYECKNLEKDRKQLSRLFSKIHIHETFLGELKKTADTNLKEITEIVHKELEERVKPTGRNLAIQQKMKFEIESVLEHTLVSNFKSYQLHLTSNLKDDLLRIKGVEGLAMFCRELQVHITEFSNVQQEKEVLRQIDEVIVKHKYWQSYKIGVITKKPEKYCSVGATLYCPALDRHGTLGGFMVDMNENLYFLTCAHIVPNNVDVHVEIQQEAVSLTIGRSVKLQVGTENHMSVDSVDIMAVRVNSEQNSICIPFFKKADGNFGPSVMVQPFDLSLKEYHNIYKWGACTHLTRGILHTGNYNIELFSDCGLNDSKYIYVLIEKPPVDDDNNETFAMPGDSGAIVCAEGEDEIQTIAMVQGGDMDIRTGLITVKYTLGFYLWCSLDKLLKRSDLYLTTVPFSKEKLVQVLQISEEKLSQVL